MSPRERTPLMLDLPLDRLLALVAAFDRETAKDHLQHFSAVPLDFTDDYLESLPTDRLRHVLVAACLRARRAH
jgi:hypothetical protein